MTDGHDRLEQRPDISEEPLPLAEAEISYGSIRVRPRLPTRLTRVLAS